MSGWNNFRIKSLEAAIIVIRQEYESKPNRKVSWEKYLAYQLIKDGWINGTGY
jgi:hypothetical protein